MPPDEEIIKERVKEKKEGSDSIPGGDAAESRRNNNRLKKEAKKRKWAADREELRSLREGKGKGGKGGGGKPGGAGRGGAGNPGEEECYAWNNGNGLCGGLPAGSQCKGKVQRLHRCTVCKSPGHPSKDCPQRKGSGS